jgi:hypothetical protein
MGNDEVPTLPGGASSSTFNLTALSLSSLYGYWPPTTPANVSTDTISNVLRTYRKYLDLSPEEGAIVERLSNDLFEAMESDARTLLEHVSSAIG